MGFLVGCADFCPSKDASEEREKSGTKDQNELSNESKKDGEYDVVESCEDDEAVMVNADDSGMLESDLEDEEFVDASSTAGW